MAKKQKSGLYRSKVKIGVDANGKDVFKYISGHTKAELDQHRREVIDHYITGTGLEKDQLFGAYATEWYRVRKEPYIRKGTKDTYRSMLNKHILPTFGNRKLRSIRSTELQEFLQQFADSSRSHIVTARLILSGIFLSACQDHILKDNPAQFLANPESKRAVEKPTLTDEDRAALERVCATELHGDFLAVLYYLGLRIGEAAALKWSDFDLDARIVHIQRKLDYHDGASIGAPKTAKSDRLLPIPKPLHAILTSTRQVPEMYLFHGKKNLPVKRCVTNAWWLELMTAAGLTHEETRTKKGKETTVICPNITPHALRHNYVTMCYESGLDTYTTMRLAGHTNISTTLNIYTHLRDEQLKKTQKEVDSMFEPKSCKKVANPTET